MSFVDTAHLDPIIESYRRGDDFFDIANRLVFAHAAHLEELGPVRSCALDPCPRCDGYVVASETVARCTRCDFTVAGGVS